MLSPKPPGMSATVPSHVGFVSDLKTGDEPASPDMVWPRQSALRSHPCVARSSAPVHNSVNQNEPNSTRQVTFQRKNHCQNPGWQGITILSWHALQLAGFEVTTTGRF